MSFAWRDSHPNNPGSTPSDVLRRSSRETVNKPCTSIASLPLVHHADARRRQPTGLTHRAESALLGARHRDQHPARRFGEQRDERVLHPRESRCGNRFHRPARPRRRPASARPRTDRAPPTPARHATRRPARRRAASRAPGRPRGGTPAEMVGGDLRPDRAVELVAGVAEQDQRLAGFGAQVRSGRRRLDVVRTRRARRRPGWAGSAWCRSGCRS